MSDDIELPELLPCPFCGGEAKLFRETCIHWSVGCEHCNATTGYKVGLCSEYAVAAWNKRAAVELNQAVPDGFVLMKKSDVQNLVSYFSGDDVGIRYGAAKLSALRAQKLLNTTAPEHGEG